MSIKRSQVKRFALVEKEARGIISQYTPNWKFGWNKRKTSAGRCVWSSATEGTIYLSYYFVASLETTNADIKDTILHEVAHALAGQQSGHGVKWQRIAASLGAKPTRCLSKPFLEGRWVWQCKKCGLKASWHRAPYLLRGRAICKKCKIYSPIFVKSK